MKNFVVIFVITFLFSIPCLAQEYKVLALVNGKAISTQQLHERVDIILDSSGLKKDNENKLKVAKEAIEILINENLQAQEAKDKGVAISEREFASSIADLEAKNNMKPGSFKEFVEGRGLSFQAALEQIKAGLLWKKTVTKFLRPNIKISKKEIKKRQKQLEAIATKKVYGISEIILPLDTDNKNSSQLVANKLVKDARAGADFKELAKKYSAGRTAKNGGFVGYIPVDKVTEPLSSMILNTPEGGVSDPKLVENAMYVILKVDTIKEVGPRKDDESIEEAILIEKLEKESKKYIKKLRQKSFIEKKYTNEDELI
jgi:peptidyl-prolyl cis-trans isomerase SurA